eukprot:TRINITY_DN4524_c0_g1_i1.p1 TRINITY_DN4524_c0_g1~~TRINITY_DN4524_c0_g1_i1.p1  ORF type:complete len:499 (+),score=129.33 TRINITY_DN4524_c0_g1_i1:109-1605(+)
MRVVFFVALVAFFTTIVAHLHDDELVVRTKIHKPEQWNIVKRNDIDIWKHRENSGTVDILVKRSHLETLKENKIDHEILIENLSELVKGVQGDHEETDFFSKYRTLDEIESFLEGLEKKHPDLVEVSSIGKTVKNKKIAAVKLSAKNAKTKRNKPQIVILSGQHAREWIGPASTLYVISSLVTSYSSRSSPSHKLVKKLLQLYEWNFVPILNADGYDVTWNGQRLLRANSRGVDLNRNWNIHWNGEGLPPTSDPARDNGAGPWSEPETEAIHHFLRSKKNLALFLDIHSYGQVILEPYAFSCDLPPDHDLLSAIGSRFKAAVESVNKREYKKEKICLFAADATGSSVDYVYQILGALSFAIELPDEGKTGFLLPASEIKPVGQEVEAGLLQLANELRTPRSPGKVRELVAKEEDGEILISWKQPVFKGTPNHSSQIVYELKFSPTSESSSEASGKVTTTDIGFKWTGERKEKQCSSVVFVRATNRNGKGEWEKKEVRC